MAEGSSTDGDSGHPVQPDAADHEQPDVSFPEPRRRLPEMRLPPLSEHLQSFLVYETESKFYIIGSTENQEFKLLKIDREEPRELVISEDPTTYSRQEIHHLLSMIQSGNPSLKRLPTCHGIFGFVRFLHGYYMCLITAVKKVATLGGHLVYSIEDTSMVPVPRHLNEALDPDVAPTKAKKYLAQEKKYRSYFGLFDVRKNFYFSYTLDLSRTLQNLMLRTRDGLPAFQPRSRYIWNHFLLQPFLQGDRVNINGRVAGSVDCTRDPDAAEADRAAAAAAALRSRRLWVVHAIHGFYEQTLCSVYGKRLCLTLVSRRSRYFAGTRYLKRGVNDDGQVANDVETEQILHDRTRGNSHEGDFCSYVQLRASIPVFWCQESNAMVAKPPILVHRSDPLHMATRLHFSDLFLRYGSPLLALNLVRQQEKTPREMIIGQVFGEAVNFLNQFIPKPHRIDYLAWDFKKHSRMRQVSVVDELAVIAHWAVQRTGLFHPHPRPDSRQVRAHETMHLKPSHESLRNLDMSDANVARLQKGVLRVNCIDSLDRTNVAQFVVGKCALGYMLYALGFTPPPTKHEASKGGGGLSSGVSISHFPVASELVQVLLAMYERMGDRLAFQYGGSQMHRQMKKDRAKSMPMKKTSVPLADKPKEMLVSLMRHYQNSFQDTSKQDAINLFLGRYIPSRDSEDSTIWELNSDYYLHHKSMEEVPFLAGRCVFANDSWWRTALRKHEENDGDEEGVKLVDEIPPVLQFQPMLRRALLPESTSHAIYEWRRPGHSRAASAARALPLTPDSMKGSRKGSVLSGSERPSEPKELGTSLEAAAETSKEDASALASAAGGERGADFATAPPEVRRETTENAAIPGSDTSSMLAEWPSLKKSSAEDIEEAVLSNGVEKVADGVQPGVWVTSPEEPVDDLGDPSDRAEGELPYDATRTHPASFCGVCGRLAEPKDILAMDLDGTTSLDNAFPSFVPITHSTLDPTLSVPASMATSRAAGNFFWSQAQLQRETRLRALQMAQAKARERLAEEARAVGAAAYTAVLAAAGLQQGEFIDASHAGSSGEEHEQHEQETEQKEEKEKQQKNKEKPEEEKRQLLAMHDGYYDAACGPHPAALFTCLCETQQQLNGMLKFQHLYPAEVLEGFDAALQDPLCRPHYVRVLGAGESKRSMIAERLRRFGTAAAGLVMPGRRSPNPSPAHQQGQRGDKNHGLTIGLGGDFKFDALLPIEPLRDLALIDQESLRRAEIPATQDLFSRYARFGFRDAMLYELTAKEHEMEQEKEQERQLRMQEREQLRNRARLQAARLLPRKASLGSPWIVLFPENKTAGQGNQAVVASSATSGTTPVPLEASRADNAQGSAVLGLAQPERDKQSPHPPAGKFSAELAREEKGWWADEGESVPPTPMPPQRQPRSSRALPSRTAGPAGAERPEAETSGNEEPEEGVLEEELLLEEEEEETASLDSPNASPLKEQHFKVVSAGENSPEKATEGTGYWQMDSPVKVSRLEGQDELVEEEQHDEDEEEGLDVDALMQEGSKAEKVYSRQEGQTAGSANSVSGPVGNTSSQPCTDGRNNLSNTDEKSGVSSAGAESSEIENDFAVGKQIAAGTPAAYTATKTNSSSSSSLSSSLPVVSRKMGTTTGAGYSFAPSLSSSSSSQRSNVLAFPPPPLLYAPGRNDLGDNPISNANFAIFTQYTKFGFECRDDWLEQSFQMETGGEVAKPVHFELHNKSLDFYAGYRQETTMAPVGPTFSHLSNTAFASLEVDPKRTSPARKQSAAAYAARKRRSWNWSPTKQSHAQQLQQGLPPVQVTVQQPLPHKVSIDSPSQRGAAEAVHGAPALQPRKAPNFPSSVAKLARRRLWSGDSTDSNEDMKEYVPSSAINDSLNTGGPWDDADFVSRSPPSGIPSPVSSSTSSAQGLADFTSFLDHRGSMHGMERGVAGTAGRHPTLDSGSAGREERLVHKAATSRQTAYQQRMSPTHYPRPPPPGSIRAVEEPDSEDEEDAAESSISLSASSIFLRATRDNSIDLLRSAAEEGNLHASQSQKRAAHGIKRRDQGSPNKPRFDLNS